MASLFVVGAGVLAAAFFVSSFFIYSECFLNSLFHKGSSWFNSSKKISRRHIYFSDARKSVLQRRIRAQNESERGCFDPSVEVRVIYVQANVCY